MVYTAVVAARLILVQHNILLFLYLVSHDRSAAVDGKSRACIRGSH